MKRLNNKGFAISTILFSILILGTLVFGTLYSTMIYNSTEKASENCPSDCPKCVCPTPPEEEVEDRCTDEFIIGTEHFCVLYKDSTNVVALAKYNLNLGSNKVEDEPAGLQSKKTNEYGVGTVAAATNIYIPQGHENEFGYYKILSIRSNVNKYNTVTDELSKADTIISNMSQTLSGYVSDYKTKLNQIINDSNLGINSLNVRLLNIDDLSDTNNFSCLDIYNKTILYYHNKESYGNNTWDCTENSDNRWLFNTNYWTSVANLGGQDRMYILSIKGSIIYKDDSGTESDLYGIRPVIEISRSDFNRMKKA